jgi:hypothetical protein
MEADDVTPAGTTPAAVLESREESLRRSLQRSPQRSPEPLEVFQEEEEYVRPPDAAYTERLRKDSPTGFVKREAWSGDRSMPAALESVSGSRSITPGGTISQQAS